MDWVLLFVIFVFVMGIGFIVMMNHAKDLTEQRDTSRTRLAKTVKIAEQAIEAVSNGDNKYKWQDAVSYYVTDDCNLVEKNKELQEETKTINKRNAELNKFNREDILDID